MIRGAMLALLLLPLGCTVNALPGSQSTRLGAGDGGTGGQVDLGSGAHGDGGGCGGGSVDLGGGWGGDGGWWWSDAGSSDGASIDSGGGYDGGPIDAGHVVDLAH